MMSKKSKAEEIELSDKIASRKDECNEIKIDLSEPVDEPAKKPLTHEQTLHDLPVLTQAQKQKLLLIITGVVLVFATWLITSNIPIYDALHQAGFLDLNKTNGTGEILDLPTCPPPVVLTNCTTIEPCHCEPPRQVCPPVLSECRQCPEQHEPCSEQNCACPARSPAWKPPENEHELLLSDLDFLVNPLTTVLGRSQPRTLYRLKQINKFLSIASAWFNILSYRSVNTGIHHSGQGGDVGRSCRVCRERNEWLRCVYSHNITGFALIKEMRPDEMIMSRPGFDWLAKYQRAAYNTSMYGYHAGWKVHPRGTPTPSDALKLEHYDATRFLHKIMTLEYADADGKRGVCTLCKELSRDQYIYEHMSCIWRRSVSVMELLHDNDLDKY